jgi:hypothetical protein
MWVRVMRADYNEVLINTDHIWKLEVSYCEPHEELDNAGYKLSVNDAQKNPEAIRCYTIHIGTEVIAVATPQPSKQAAVLDEIYDNAIKD